MFQFLKESIKEFDHVVWPTGLETKKYFQTVITTIVVLTLFLFVVGTALSSGLFKIKEYTPSLAPAPKTATSTTPLKASDLKLETTPVNTTGATK